MAGTRERKEHRLKLFVASYLSTGRLDLSAEAAGYHGKPVSLSVQGSRLLKAAKAAGLMEQARERIVAKVEAKTDRTMTKAIEMLWEEAEETRAAEILKGYDEQGNYVPKLARFKPQVARIRLLDFYAPKEGDQPKTPPLPPVTINILGVLKDENVRTALIGAARGYHVEDRSRGNGVEP